MTAPFDLDAYLRRLGLDAPPPATAAGLARVHFAQMQAIVFENLDVVLGRGISLDPATIAAKLLGGRGGYCFESNIMLAEALEALGFDVRIVLGRVIVSDPPAVPPRTHAAVLVELDEELVIVDAGFGGPTPRHPVTLGRPAAPGSWQAVRDQAHGWCMQRVGEDGSAKDLYVFDLQRVFDSDMMLGNHWTSTHPSSHFTRRPIVARHLPDGRRTLIADRVSLWTGEAPESRVLEDAADLAHELREEFGLDIDATEAEFEHLLALGRAASTPGVDPRS